MNNFGSRDCKTVETARVIMGIITSSAVLAFLWVSGMLLRNPKIWLKNEVTHSARLPVDERAIASVSASVSCVDGESGSDGFEDEG